MLGIEFYERILDSESQQGHDHIGSRQQKRGQPIIIFTQKIGVHIKRINRANPKTQKGDDGISDGLLYDDSHLFELRVKGFGFLDGRDLQSKIRCYSAQISL